MSLQSCAELIWRIQHNRAQQTSSPTRGLYRSYISDCIGSEERPCIRFGVLVAPSDVAIISKVLPDSCLSAAGWGSLSTRRAPSCLVIRKGELDRPWKGSPSTIRPAAAERKGWFLSSEAERINLANSERDATEKHRAITHEQRPAHVKRITGLIEDPEDKGSSPFTPTTQKRCDLEAFCRERLKKLFGSKLQHLIARKLGTGYDPAEVTDALAQAAVWQAKRLSAREIAERTGRTQGWVRWRLAVASKVFLSLGIKDLSERSHQKSEMVAD